MTTQVKITLTHGNKPVEITVYSPIGKTTRVMRLLAVGDSASEYVYDTQQLLVREIDGVLEQPTTPSPDSRL